MKESKLGIDSNIMIYALDKSSSHNKEVVDLFEGNLLRSYALFLTQQNILETQRVLIQVYKQNKKDVVNAIENLTDYLQITLLSPLPSTIFTYNKIMINYKKQKFDLYDLFLASTYLDHGINKILTFNNKDFESIDRFTAINPSSKFSLCVLQ